VTAVDHPIPTRRTVRVVVTGPAAFDGALAHALAERLDVELVGRHPEIEAAVGQVLERWGVPAGTPSRRWRELAAARGAAPETAAELGRLADDLHYLRHAPQLSATATLKSEALASCRSLLRRAR